jgi:oligosaccharide repeat unit polymerase
MAWLAATLLAVLLVVTYMINGGVLLSSAVIAISAFLVSSLVFAVSSDYFGSSISWYTVAIMLEGLILLSVGESLVLRTRRLNNVERESPSSGPISVPLPAIVTLSVIGLGIGVARFRELFAAMGSIAEADGFIDAMTDARVFLVENTEGGQYLESRFISQGSLLIEAFAFLCTFAFLYNRRYHHLTQCRYIIVLLVHMICLVAHTGRTGYIRFFVVALMYTVIFSKSDVSWRRTGNVRIVVNAVLALALVLLVFRLTGYIQGSSQRHTLTQNFQKYVGSSVFGLDAYLNGLHLRSEYWGQETFHSLIRTAQRIGLVDIRTVGSANDVFYQYGSGTANVYSGFRRIIADFSINGLFVWQFLLGIVSGVILRGIVESTKATRDRFVSLTVTGLFLYPIVMMGIEYQFESLLSTTFLFEVFYLILLGRLFVHRASRSHHGTKVASPGPSAGRDNCVLASEFVDRQSSGEGHAAHKSVFVAGRAPSRALTGRFARRPPAAPLTAPALPRSSRSRPKLSLFEG